jgi:hypothetical protein
VASADNLIGSPLMPSTAIAPDGCIHETWGDVLLSIEEPAGAKIEGQALDKNPGPVVVTTKVAGNVKMTEQVYRAPIFPEGVDVLTADIIADKETDALVRVSLPDAVSVGESRGMVGGQAVLSVFQAPAPQRKMKPWGCAGGVTPLPGWAQPQGECDPAFKNISAGMGGVPIEYRFAAPPGEKRAVVLGFCESFWGVKGQRMMEIAVEGALKLDIDPIAEWGQHVPGCLRFSGSDEDKDGYIKVVVAPLPKSADQNPILNAIWVFKDESADLDDVKAGKLSDKAEYYVSVGGEKDQLLYEKSPLEYRLKLAPGQPQTLVFLLAIPGCDAPNPKKTAWTTASLRKAADVLWTDWLARNKDTDYAKAFRQ